MNQKIGVMVDGFRTNLDDGIEQARRLGATAVQINVGEGEAKPANLSPERRREILARVADAGMVVSAVCGDMGGHGWANADEHAWRIPEHERQMELAQQWNCHVLTTHIGVIPEDPAHPRYAVMLDAARRLGEMSRAYDLRIAIETGAETPEVLLGFLEAAGASLGVNYDPANLVMVMGVDPVQGARTLGERIVHTHAKDGKQLRYVGPEIVYGFFAEGGIGDLRMSECFLETPLGEGDVDFPRYIAALREVGYDGYFTIEREVGADPAADIGKAVRFLQRLL